MSLSATCVSKTFLVYVLLSPGAELEEGVQMEAQCC